MNRRLCCHLLSSQHDGEKYVYIIRLFYALDTMSFFSSSRRAGTPFHIAYTLFLLQRVTLEEKQQSVGTGLTFNTTIFSSRVISENRHRVSGTRQGIRDLFC